MAKNSTISDPYFCISIWPLDVPRVHLIIFGISQAISFPFTIIANSMLIYALYKTGQLNTTSNKFILMMSISDMLIGLIGQPMIIIMMAIKEIFRNCTLERCLEYLVFLLANFSWFMLLLISVDRYFQVTKLNRYSEYMNPYRMKVAIIVSVLAANALAVVLLLTPSFTLQVILNIANILMMTFVASLYAYMMRRLKEHDKNLKATQMKATVKRARHLISNESSHNDQPEANDITPNHEELKNSRKQLSALKTIRMLIVAIFALYGPYNIASAYWAYYKFGKRVNPPFGINVFVLWAYFIVLTNTALNACIIINGNSKTRRFVLLILRRANFSQNKVLVSSEQASAISHVIATKAEQTKPLH